MPRCGRWGTLVGVMSAIGLMVTVAWAQTGCSARRRSWNGSGLP